MKCRATDETIKQFKIRLCENRELYGLTWQGVADAINAETGDTLGESAYRKWWSSFNDGMRFAKEQKLSDDKILQEYELKRINFEKEKQKFYDQRNSYSRMIRDGARKDEMFELLLQAVENSDCGSFEQYTPKLLNSNNDLMVGLNDLHYGLIVKNAFNEYSPEICKKYLDKYLKDILDIQATHKSENCFVFGAGDQISGNIHSSIRFENRENVIDQVKGVSNLIGEFLYELSKHFQNVTFASVAGNHSRLGDKEDSHKYERLDDFILWWLKAKLQNQSNVHFIDNIDTTMSVVKIRGKKYLLVHGDYDSSNKAISNLNLMNGNDAYAVFCGHMHHNCVDYLNYMKIIMSGSFVGMDSYCIQKRIVGIPQQLVCVCTDEGVLTTYDINFKN